MQRHREKLEVVAQRALDHTKGQTTGEILVQLQDYLHQRASDMRKLFVKYDENGAGRITRAHFKKVSLIGSFKFFMCIHYIAVFSKINYTAMFFLSYQGQQEHMCLVSFVLSYNIILFRIRFGGLITKSYCDLIIFTVFV